MYRYRQGTALLKIEAVSFGVNTALQELARTEIPVSSCRKQQAFWFVLEVIKCISKILGKILYSL